MNDTSIAAVPRSILGRAVETPLCVVAVLCACVLYMAAMLWRTRDDSAGADQALNAAIGHELNNGRRLYAEVWDQKPPVVYVAYAAAERVVGYGPWQFFVLNLTGWIVALVGLYRAGSLLAGRRAGLGAAIFWAILVVQPEWFEQPNGEVFINASLVWSVFFLLRLMASPSWWLACAFGAAVGIASLAKPTAFAAAGLMGIAYIVASWSRDGTPWLALKHMIAAAGVSAALWVCCIAWFWSQGSLADFYDTVVVYNRHYSGSLLQNLSDLFQGRNRRYMLAVIISCLAVPWLAVFPGARRNEMDGSPWPAGPPDARSRSA